MAITNYSELKTAIADWLGRTDLTTKIPDFIRLAESDIRRNLRPIISRSSFALTAGADEIELAVGACDELRMIRYDSSDRQYALKIVSADALAGLRRSGTGLPHYAAMMSNKLMFDIAPDSAYLVETTCYTYYSILNDAGPTNALLTSSPDLYLFGALKEAELYLEHDERNPIWSAKYQKAIADENIARERAELGSAPATIKLPMIFG